MSAERAEAAAALRLSLQTYAMDRLAVQPLPAIKPRTWQPEGCLIQQRKAALQTDNHSDIDSIAKRQRVD